MKQSKRCLVMFSFYDRTGIETFLEKQAENGWMLDKTSAFGWHFHRITPKKINFSVVYFSKASAFDPEPSEHQLSFQDFCEHTGWRLAASNAQMQIFYNETDNPTPIETDAVLEVSTIHASARKTHLLSYYGLAAVGVLQAALFIGRLISDPMSVVASNASLFTGLCWALMLIMSIVEIVGYHSWYRRAKAAAEFDGSFVETKGHRNFQITILCFMLLAFAFLLISYGGSKMTMIAFTTIAVILGITAIIVWISELMKKLKLSAKLNRIITIVLTFVLSFGLTGVLLFSVVDRITTFIPEKTVVETYDFRGMTFDVYHDELPLKIEDLIETDYSGYSYKNFNLYKSFLAEQQDITQRPRMDALDQPKLEYSITTVKFPLLYDWCKSVLLDDFDHNYGRPEDDYEMWKTQIEIDAAPWGANEAYQLKLGGELQMRFLLCYDDCIVEISFDHDWVLTTEHMKVVGEKLGN